MRVVNDSESGSDRAAGVEITEQAGRRVAQRLARGVAGINGDQSGVAGGHADEQSGGDDVVDAGGVPPS